MQILVPMGNTLTILSCGSFALLFLHYSIFLSTITGFPLYPGDFHLQNIMITDINTSTHQWRHRLGVVWPNLHNSFHAIPPFRHRSPCLGRYPPTVRTERTRSGHIWRAHSRNRACSQPSPRFTAFTDLISNGYGVYLFKQMIQSPIMFSVLYPLLFAHILCENRDFSRQYYRALMEKGILEDNERFNKENRVWLEAWKVLGEDVVGRNLSSRIWFRCILTGLMIEESYVNGWHLQIE